MSGHLERYLRNKPNWQDGDYLELQRSALHEILTLRAETVRPVEEEIEQQYQDSLEAAKARFGERTKEIEGHYDARGQVQDEASQGKLQSIEGHYKQAMQSLEAKTRLERDRIVGDAEARDREARHECEYDILTAENIAEGTVSTCQSDRRKLEGLLVTSHRELGELAEQADATVQWYRQKVPSVAGLPKEDVGELGLDELRREYEAEKEAVEAAVERLGQLSAPRFFVGITPYVLAGLISATLTSLALAVQYVAKWEVEKWYVLAIVVGGVSLAGVLLAGRVFWRKARQQVHGQYRGIQQQLLRGKAILERHKTLGLADLERRAQEAVETREAELRQAREQFQNRKAMSQQLRQESLESLQNSYAEQRDALTQNRTHTLSQAQEEHARTDKQVHQERQEQLSGLQDRYARRQRRYKELYEASRRQLEQRWDQAVGHVEKLLEETRHFDGALLADWSDPLWDTWQPSGNFSRIVGFGEFQIGAGELAEAVRGRPCFGREPGGVATFPTVLAIPERCSLLLQSERDGHDEAIGCLRSVMLRLLTALPPGRVRFTIVDPVGLGENFAGFMHAADYQEALVGRRIWTEAAHIQQQLADLTDHMETIIQKHLRNDFETIEQYNRQAGELAEPYRFLVLADFPSNFTEEAARRLSSIVNSGKRCGVYTLIAYDARQSLPDGLDVADLAANSIHLKYEAGHFVWQDKVLKEFPVTLGAPPTEERLSQIVHTVGQAARNATRVEVPFEAIAPSSGRLWTKKSDREINIALGRTGATRLQYLKLGRGVAQHALIAGKTGSGKSTLLHVIVTNLAMWYAPEEVEVYLIDFKRGVEFKTYVTHELAHARVVAIESDREFGLSVLQRLDAEMARRGVLFREVGVQDVAQYREVTGKPLPRVVLIVDEFQVFFSEDDKLSQDAALALEQLVRQGRAFGVHVILGSQTLGGTSGLARSTIGQMTIRIALQCSEADAQLIMDDDNVAARMLTRPGEALYNDSGGQIVGNSPFQISWLADSKRDECLEQVARLSQEHRVDMGRQIVFEGNVPADICDSGIIDRCLRVEGAAKTASPARAWLGQPVAIKDPTAVAFARLSGANLLIVGQRDEAALGLFSAALLSLAAHHGPEGAQYVVLDGSAPDSATEGVLERLANTFGLDCRSVGWREVADVVAELAQDVEHRRDHERSDMRPLYLFVYGLGRYRILRRNEDDFSFGSSEGPASADRQFADILREGPLLGLHSLVWADTLATAQRTLDRQTLREFDNRVLFQMSSADSSQLTDSPIANRLGFHRALFYSEESGQLEKFRPFASPEAQCLAELTEAFARKWRPAT